MTTLQFSWVDGLTEQEQLWLNDLADIFNYHQSRNTAKDKYYEGHITLRDVNIGIALPNGLNNLTVGCNWGQKAVDVLAARSMFDGFVGKSGNAAETMTKIAEDNRLVAEYGKACRDELKYGCTFATLSLTEAGSCRIRFHSPATAAARWSGEKGRIECGLAIIDTMPDEKDAATWHPGLVNFYTDEAIIALHRVGNYWRAERWPHQLGRPLMEPLIWNATNNKPFGRSRLKRPIRALIDDYVRILADATIALEFDTTPQKYILGVTDEQYDAIVSNKFQQYVGSIIAATTNPETGSNPSFGQLSQGSLTPHVEKMRVTATQFSAATGLTVTDVGVINDANPTSCPSVVCLAPMLVANTLEVVHPVQGKRISVSQCPALSAKVHLLQTNCGKHAPGNYQIRISVELIKHLSNRPVAIRLAIWSLIGRPLCLLIQVAPANSSGAIPPILLECLALSWREQ